MSLTVKQSLCAALLCLATGGTALAAGPAPAAPSLISTDGRIKELPYSDDDVYTITTKYGYQTNIVFGKGEQIQTISVGDRSLWQLIPAGNRLFIRPMVYGIETNMTLITNKHSYQFDLKSVPNDKSNGNIYVARFVYGENKTNAAEKSELPPAAILAQTAFNQHPPEAPPAQPAHLPLRSAPSQPAPAPAHPASTAARPAPAPAMPEPQRLTAPNYNYTYTGPDAAAPVKAYDDGKSTFIQYRTDQPLPSVYMVDASGNATPVSYNIKDNLIVIDKIAGEWLLKQDHDSVHLYNELLNSK